MLDLNEINSVKLKFSSCASFPLKICGGFNLMYSTKQVYKTLEVPFLTHVLNFIYNRKSRPDLLNNREIRTRAHDAPIFNVQIPRCEAFKRSVGYFGAVEWNNLPPDMRNMDPYLVFKFHNRKEMLKPLEHIAL